MSRHHRPESNVTRYNLLHEFYAIPDAADRLDAALDAMRDKPTESNPEGRRRLAYTTAYAVLVMRLTDTGKEGRSWTAQGTIAGRLRVNRDTVRLADRAALDAGLMANTGRKNEGSPVYQMLPERFDPMPEAMPEYSGMGVVDNSEPMPEAMPEAMPEYSGTTSTGSGDRRSSSPTTPYSSSAPPPAFARPVEGPPEAGKPADDDEIFSALHDLPGRPRATREVRRLVGIALDDLGHTATTLNAYLRASMTGNVTNGTGLVTQLLREAPVTIAPDPPAAPAEWCGQCEPDDSPDARWVMRHDDPDDPEVITYMGKCPTCHPHRAKVRALRPTTAQTSAVAARRAYEAGEPARVAAR